MPRITRAKQAPLSRAEIHALLSEFDKHHPTLAPAIRLMAHLGLRVGEASRARADWFHDLGSANPTLHIPAEVTKTSTARTLPIPPTLAAWLLRNAPVVYQQDLLGQDHPTLLTRNRWNTAVSHTYLCSQLRQTAIGSIGRPVRPHTLRHTFATQLLRHTNIRIVQATLGHRSIASTVFYTHPTLDDIRNALHNMELPDTGSVIA